MAATLIEQKASLEKAIEQTKDYSVREALQSALTEVNKKIAKKDGRKATLKDGVVVAIGDNVFSYYYNKHENRLIIRHKNVTAVNADGTEIGVDPLKQGYRSITTEPASRFYSTREAAIDSFKAEQMKAHAYTLKQISELEDLRELQWKLAHEGCEIEDRHA